MDFHHYGCTCKNPLQEHVESICPLKGNKITAKSSTSDALLNLPGTCVIISAGKGSIYLRKVMLLNPNSLFIMATAFLGNLSTKIATKATF